MATVSSIYSRLLLIQLRIGPPMATQECLTCQKLQLSPLRRGAAIVSCYLKVK